MVYYMRILTASDSPYIPSGFAQQLKGVSEHLVKTHELSYLGWQTQGDIDLKDWDFKILGSSSRFGKSDYIPSFKKTNPQLLITLGDAHMVDVLGQIPHPLWIGYYPLDGHPISPLIGSVIKQMDIPLAMSWYGYDLTKKELGIEPKYIPHFYRKEHFSNLGEEHKAEYRKELGIPADAFIIGSLSRLNPRKHHQRLLVAFRDLLKNNPDRDDIYLYLHLDPHDPLMFSDPNHNYQFMEWLDSLGIANRVLLTNKNSYLKGIPVEELNRIVNTWDVHVIPTGGEGFGVPFVEVAATGIPTIATDYTTTGEHIYHADPYSGEKLDDINAHRGLAVRYSRLFMEMSQVNKAWVDIDALTESFQTYLDEPELLLTHGINAQAYVERWYEYEVIMAKWDELIAEIYNGVDIK